MFAAASAKTPASSLERVAPAPVRLPAAQSIFLRPCLTSRNLAALRVWDWFMFRGTKVLFRVALAITDLAAAYLLEACPSITELLGFLLHIPHSLVDADALIAAASKVKISERHIDRLTGRLSAPSNPSKNAIQKH
ncbi:hypothetical protein GGI17_000226 [Coemansia sp. S146]|nr:hypothetical protein GGI17_000226 [Coemansia sp. S146]